MALWGKNDQANNAPKFRVSDKYTVGSTAGRTDATIANTYNTRAQGVMTVAADVAETKVNKAVVHPGWQVVREGTGPVTAITFTGATGWAVNDTITLGGGTRNGSATVTAVSAGNPTAVTVTDGGAGFRVASQVTLTPSGAGTGGTSTVTLGGRAGRKHFETLVAMGSITGDGADDATLPDA